MRAVALLALLFALMAAPARAAEVRVMTFNIWLGGDVVDFGKVIETIRASRADVVGLQEAEGNTRRIAAALGWPYWSDRLHVVSRHPLIDPPEAKGEYVLVQLRPGEVFALSNVHLTSDPYDALLVSRGRVLSRSGFWVVARGARPSVRARGTRISWRNAPGNRRDWVGIWKAGDTDLYNDYLAFAYTGARVAGASTIPGRLPPGRYVVRLMEDDGYAELARSSFRVTGSSARAGAG